MVSRSNLESAIHPTIHPTPQTPDPAHADRAHDALKGMTYAQGAAALAPDEQGKSDDKPLIANVYQTKEGEYDSASNTRSNYQAWFTKGQNHGLKEGMRVVCAGVSGRIVEVFPTKARAVFFDPVAFAPTLTIYPNQTWSKAQADAARQKRDQEKAKQDEKRYTDEYSGRRPAKK